VNRKTAILLIAGGVLIAIGLSLAFAFPLRDAFRAAVAEPFISSFYLFRWYLHRISQAVLWGTFVLLGGFLLARSFAGAFPSRRKEYQGRIRAATEPVSELDRLATIIGHTHRRPFARRRMAVELSRLAIRMIAKREGISLKEARTRFESFDWCSDGAIADFFSYRRQYHGLRRGRDFSMLLHKTVSFLERYYQGV
jgi:hypothetical protein